jgi:small subunit ribosomal protein S7
MPRRARSYDKHTPLPDPKFGSVKYSKFINHLMERGKKTVAQKIFYAALEIVGDRVKQQKDKEQAKDQTADTEQKEKVVVDPRQVFDLALKNVSPMVEIKGRRIGGSNYQVPMEVQEPRRSTLGMKWLIAAANARKGMPMAEKLALEIIEASQKLGSAIKKRDDTHRMAEANKAFAHFARFGSRR